jgi:nucleotidyltransferase/DNA polymerase involved in DNA repair
VKLIGLGRGATHNGRYTQCEKLAHVLRQRCEEADRRLRKRTKGLPREITGLLVDVSPPP